MCFNILGEYVQKTAWHRIAVFKPGLKDVASCSLVKGLVVASYFTIYLYKILALLLIVS